MSEKNPFKKIQSKAEETYTLVDKIEERKNVKNPGRNLRFRILKDLESDPDFKDKIDPAIREELERGYPRGEVTTTFNPNDPFKKEGNHFGRENEKS